MGTQISREIKKRLSSRSEVYDITNQQGKKCDRCNVKFTFSNRKHYCKSCGGIFCSSCTNKRAIISHLKKKGLSRVCEECFISIGKESFLGSPQSMNDQAIQCAVIVIQKIYRGYRARQDYKFLKKRTHIVRELLETEKTYCNSLWILINTFMKPLQEELHTKNSLNISKDTSLLDKDSIRRIFSVVEVLYGINLKFLDSLQNKMKFWSFAQTIGDIFLEIKDVLRAYVQYVNNYNNALLTLNLCIQKRPMLAEFLERCYQDPKINGQNITSYLITPIQRIPRYVLLLQELLKSTKKFHPDYKILQVAIEEIKNLAEVINKSKREWERMESVIKIYNTLKPSYDDLIVPHRYFISEGDLFEVTTSNTLIQSKSKHYNKIYHYFLFNDFLLLTKFKKPFYKVKYPFILKETTITCDEGKIKISGINKTLNLEINETFIKNIKLN